MTYTGVLQILITLAVMVIAAVPLSKYLAHVFKCEPTFIDGIIDPAENLTLKFLEVNGN